MHLETEFGVGVLLVQRPHVQLIGLYQGHNEVGYADTTLRVMKYVLDQEQR